MKLLLDGLAFPEGPRFHRGRLWFSDMHAYKVMAVDLEGRSEVITEVPGMPSGLGWLPDGDLLIVSMRDRRLLRLAGDTLVPVADLSSLASFHCNDMVVDLQGRAYIGNFGFDLDAKAKFAPAELILVTPDGAARVVAEDLLFPNGAVITPDGKTLIVAESFGARLTAFEIGADGGLDNRRVWAQLENATADGICLDADGACWVASPISNEFLRVREGGEVLQRLACEQMAIACALGGPEGRTLFCLTAPSTDPEENQRLQSARIYREEVAAPQAGWP
jgi:sugar lactone lactonase YvrE